MADAKIEVRVGEVSFVGEGEADWLSHQLDKILDAAPRLAHIVPATQTSNSRAVSERYPGAGGGAFTDTLASYIKAKDAESNQVRRFLVVADWLRRRGATELATAAVSKALKDNQQKRLGNPADCLNQNV